MADEMRGRWKRLFCEFERVVIQANLEKNIDQLRELFLARLDATLPDEVRHAVADFLAQECSVDARLERIGAQLPLERLSSLDEARAAILSYGEAYYTWLWEIARRRSEGSCTRLRPGASPISRSGRHCNNSSARD